jgi:hypothetical protein
VSLNPNAKPQQELAPHRNAAEENISPNRGCQYPVLVAADLDAVDAVMVDVVMTILV